MRIGLDKHFADRWLWLCPLLGVVMAAVVLMVFGFTLWGAVLAALMLVCPAILVWGVSQLLGEARHSPRVRK
jgi:hypothetical protein